jgi:peptidoglycan hydrolase-like protein with peptidoglycan-binding domain
MVTAISAILVVVAGVAILLVGPGKSAVQAKSVAESHQAAKPSPSPTHTVHPAPALDVVSVSPSDHARDVNGTDPIRVTFSAPLAANSPMPKIYPSVSGSWKRDGDSVVFRPSTGFTDETYVTIKVPGGASGVQSAAGAKVGAGGQLASAVSHSFTTAPYSTLRLQQLLAQLGYLPLTWTPSGTDVQPGDTAGQVAAAYSPPSGTFSWQSGWPSMLHSFWSEGSSNMITVGAIRAFESENHLTMDGEAGPSVWSALLSDVASGRKNTNGYSYAYASKSLPESLTIWHDGREVLHSVANTGIPAAPTADGTYPVYEKMPYQVMKGTNPDGSKYSDPVYNVSYFNGGDALHFFNRGSYGWPQSLGCVELPWAASKTSYEYMTYGSLVTVAG